MQPGHDVIRPSSPAKRKLMPTAPRGRQKKLRETTIDHHRPQPLEERVVRSVKESMSEQAKEEIARCEREIANIRTTLRSLGPAAPTPPGAASGGEQGQGAGGGEEDNDNLNRVVVVWDKVSTFFVSLYL
jgi:hypothetical protein